MKSKVDKYKQAVTRNLERAWLDARTPHVWAVDWDRMLQYLSVPEVRRALGLTTADKSRDDEVDKLIACRFYAWLRFHGKDVRETFSAEEPWASMEGGTRMSWVYFAEHGARLFIELPEPNWSTAYVSVLSQLQRMYAAQTAG